MMKTTLLFTLAFTFSSLNAQYFQWGKGIGGTGVDRANSITTDASGNVYTTGMYSGTVDFDPGIGVTNLTSAGAGDVFVAKYNANGALVWAKSFGGSNPDEGKSITLDAAGNIYLTGMFMGTADFDPEAAVFNLVSNGSTDIFVLKLNSSGNLIWAKSMGGPDLEYGWGIAVDGTGNVFTTGYFRATADFDPGTGTSNLVSNGYNDIFVSKLNADGDFEWAHSFGSTAFDFGFSIAVGKSGNIYISGRFGGTVDFDPGAGVFNMTAGGGDPFVLKLSSSGDFIWAKSVVGTNNGNNYGFSLVLDSLENSYTTGSYYNTGDFDPGAGTHNLTSNGLEDIFILKLDVSGIFVWAKSFGGPDSDNAYSISIDKSGNVYTTGSYSGTVDFDPGTGVYNMTSDGNTDVYISKFDNSGNFVWANSIAGSASSTGFAIATGVSGQVYIAGEYGGTVNFDPISGSSIVLISNGNTDIFFTKMDEISLSNNEITKSEFQVKLYPNPTDGNLSIQSDAQYTGKNYSISDQTGREVLKGILTDELTTVDLNQLSPGIYLLKLAEVNYQTFKIVKQ